MHRILTKKTNQTSENDTGTSYAQASNPIPMSQYRPALHCIAIYPYTYASQSPTIPSRY